LNFEKNGHTARGKWKKFEKKMAISPEGNERIEMCHKILK
jgi:hypothetical protein